MSRKKRYVIPETTRLSTTLNHNTVKELRKIGIDLEMSDVEVMDLAIQFLIKSYQKAPREAISEKGAIVFDSFVFLPEFENTDAP